MTALDPNALSTGLVQGWIADLTDALGRLMVAGIAHPDPELPETFALLGERAEVLGAATAKTHLDSLEHWTRELRPGPPDLAGRLAIAREAWDVAMILLAWLRMFRADIDVQAAAVKASGADVDGSERVDLPRYSDRVHVDGLTLTAERRLVIVGHDEHGRSVLAFDPLASADPDDPFGGTVISRLFQEQVWLGDLAGCALELERHPYTRRGNTILIQPAFRAVPKRLASDHAPGGAGTEAFEAVFSERDGEIAVRARDGKPVVLGRTLAFNVRKRMAAHGRASVSLSLVGLPRREGRVVVAANDEGVTRFPAIDARCWRVHPELLAQASASGSAWMRAASAMHGGLDGPERERLFRDVRRATVDGIDAWRLTWWAARVGGDVPDWKPEEPGATPEEGYAFVWARLWNGDLGGLRGLFDARYASLPEPELPDVCARALLLESVEEDRDSAVAYLQAHLVHLRRTGKAAPVLPPSLHLVMLADTLAWLGGTDRSGPVGDALELPTPPLRERLALRLYRWRVHGEVAGLADTLALGAICSWGRTVVG